MRIFIFVLWLALVIGYVMNIIKLVNNDFEEPYKAEVIRTIGVFTGPVGSVIGYMEFEGE